MSLFREISLQMVFFSFVYMIVYIQLRNRVLRKFHPNRWIIFTTLILVALLPKGIETLFNFSIDNIYFKYIQSAIFIVLFVWFLELKGGYIYKIGSNKSGNKSSSNTQIRPKAKPNRLKNLKG